MRLYGFWRSTATWRVRIALHYKGLEFEYVPVDLRSGEQHRPEFREKNPIGHVPVLEFLHDGRDARIAESMAIIDYLEERCPDPPLLPRDPLRRARARQLALVVVSGIQPLQNTKVQRYVDEELHADSEAWVRHWVSSGLSALEALTRETASTFSVGDAVSVADVCLVPQLSFARRFHVEVAAYSTLLRIEDACARLAPFADAHADRQVDAPPTGSS